MAWVRIDDSFSDHPKVEAAGGDAAWLYVCMLCYCNRHLTDGFVPVEKLPRLSDRSRPAALAARLAEVGLVDAVDGGWRVHDYHDYQPSRESVVAERDQAKERMRRVRKERSGSANVRPNTDRTVPNGSANVRPKFGNPDPTRPDPTTYVSDNSSLLPTVGRSEEAVDNSEDEVTVDGMARIAEAVAAHRLRGRDDVKRPEVWKRAVVKRLMEERGTELALLVLEHKDDTPMSIFVAKVEGQPCTIAHWRREQSA